MTTTTTTPHATTPAGADPTTGAATTAPTGRGGCPFHTRQRPSGVTYAAPAAPTPEITRRTVVKAAALGVSALTVAAIEGFSPLSAAAAPKKKQDAKKKRPNQATPRKPNRKPKQRPNPRPSGPAPIPGARFSDMQWDLDRFFPAPFANVAEQGGPAKGTEFYRFRPAHTLFLTAELTRTPTKADQAVFEQALAKIETTFPFRPSGIFLHVAYGLPYFNRMPRNLVQQHMPKLLEDERRWVLEEAVPGPTDVHADNPFVRKRRFDVPVRIEGNDVLITLRSDSEDTLANIRRWLAGETNSINGRQPAPAPAFKGLFNWTSARWMFGQAGAPRRLAEANDRPYAPFINPESPMWMGFADQVHDAFAPGPQLAFQGTPKKRFTTCKPTDYFANGAIQVFNHNILDLEEWYRTNGGEVTRGNFDVAYLERVQYMYRPNDPPAFGFTPEEQRDLPWGGPAHLPNEFKGNDDADAGADAGTWLPTAGGGRAQVQNHPILGHVNALQQVSRLPDGTPLHSRIDGPGFDDLDVPGGQAEPKLHFSAIVPTADLFRRMRIAQADPDLIAKHQIEPGDQGLETRLTATRRQNFLIPSRRRRSFPLRELYP